MSSLYEIWARLKIISVLVAIFAPLVVLVLNLFLPKGELLTSILVPVLLFQVSFTISQVYELQRSLSDRSGTALAGGYGISNNPIWERIAGRHLKTVDIIALNGGRILRCLNDSNVRIGTLRAVFPTMEALNVMFASLDYDGKRKRMDSIQLGIEEFETITSIMKEEGRLRECNVRRVSFFTQHFFLDLAPIGALVGHYFSSKDRSATTGLKVETRIELRAESLSMQRDLFTRIWEAS